MDDAPSRDAAELATALTTWASTQLGPLAVIGDRSRQHHRAVVLEVRADDGRRWFVKRLTGPLNFRRELHAYRQFLPGLTGVAPQLHSADEHLQVLLVSALGGVTAEQEQLRSNGEVHRAAGRWLAELHASAPPVQAPQLGPRMGRRLVQLSERYPDLLDAPSAGYVRRLGAMIDTRRDLQVVPCHLDYTQRNWLVQGGGRVGVIDFATSQLAPPVQDFGRLAHREWRSRPELRSAFLDGYGRELDPSELAVLEYSTALAALSSLIRSRETDNLGLANRSLLTFRRRNQTVRTDPGADTQQDATLPSRPSPVGRVARALNAWRER